MQSIDLSQKIEVVHDCLAELGFLNQLAEQCNLILEMEFCQFENKEALFLLSKERTIHHYNLKDMIREELKNNE